jgi:EmrB/QacA subfamily drug resistance transporter
MATRTEPHLSEFSSNVELRRKPSVNGPILTTQGRKLVLAAAMMATFMAAVENTIVATAMPTIVADLGDFHLFSWVFSAYLLTQAVSIPIYGRLADLYGRKLMFFIGAGTFLVGSTLCGFAHGMTSLIIFRALQGLGAGAVQPIAYTIVADVYSPSERARVQGFLSGVFGVAAVIGPTLGGFLVEHASWPVVFWINLPVGAIAMIMLALFYREPSHTRSYEIDYLGSFLLMVGSGALMVALVQAGNLTTREVLTWVSVGVASLAALFLHESRVAEPILPLKLWKNSEVLFCNLGSLGMGVVVIGVSAFLPTYIQGVMGRSAFVAGVAFGGTSVSWALASFVAGIVMLRTGYRSSAMIGSAAIAVGSAIFVAMTPASGPWWAAAGAVVVGTGLGFCNTTYLVAVQAATSKDQRGAATASNLFMRIVGQSIGAALFGAVVNAAIHSAHPEIQQLAEKLMDPASRKALDQNELIGLASTLGTALRYVYIISAAIGCTMLLLARKIPANPVSGTQQDKA